VVATRELRVVPPVFVSFKKKTEMIRKKHVHFPIPNPPPDMIFAATLVHFKNPAERNFMGVFSSRISPPTLLSLCYLKSLVADAK